MTHERPDAYEPWEERSKRMYDERIRPLARLFEDHVRTIGNAEREKRAMPPYPVLDPQSKQFDPFQQLGQETYHEYLTAHIRKIQRDQFDAVENAAWDALREGCTILLHEYPPHRFIGIALRHGPLQIERMQPGTSSIAWLRVMGMDLT